MTRTLTLYLGALGFLSLNPWFKPSGETAFGLIPWDKIDHAVAYGGLTVLLVLALSKTRRRKTAVGGGILIASAIGLLTEFCQAWFTDSRMFSYLDACANGVGALTGAVVLLSYHHCLGRLRPLATRIRV